MTLEQKRFLLLLFFAVILAAILYLFLGRGRGRGSVEFADIQEGMTKLLRDRARADADPEFFHDRDTPYELVYGPIPLEAVKILHPFIDNTNLRCVYDPQTMFRNCTNLNLRRVFPEHPEGGWRVISNNYGFRNDADVLEEKPDLRILVTGDSHTEGVVPNSENFPNVLGALLKERFPGRTIESLNAGVGAYSFHQYLGVIEKYKTLKPDIFVMAVYGGNDFINMLPLLWYLHRLPEPEYSIEYTLKVREASEKYCEFYAQVFGQISRFFEKPKEIHFVMKAARAIVLEAARKCKEEGIHLIVVYIPSMGLAQPGLIPEQVEPVFELLGMEAWDYGIARELKKQFLRALQESEIPCLDMEEIFSGSTEPVYWLSDYHINTLGHRLIAEALLPRVEEVMKAR
ncbi:MAG: SGNH/GDSL hydrolase family protein [Planctomycetota bacterium]|jgi:lysophospholipase L1-like esterase